MGCQSMPTAFSILLGLALLQVQLSCAAQAAEIPRSSIIEATRQKHEAASARKLQSDMQLTAEQLSQCQVDMNRADSNRDGVLDKAEFLFFLSLNSAHFGKEWGYAGNQVALDQLPLDFPMLYHTTACMCAYDNVIVNFACCEGDNGGIQVYSDGAGEDDGSTGMSDEQMIYTRMFCTEAVQAYSATLMPTEAPTPQPIGTPTASPVATSLSPTVGKGEVSSSPTTSPNMQANPTASPVSGEVVPPTVSPVEPTVTNPPTPLTTDAPPTLSPVTPATSSPSVSPNAPPTASPVAPPSFSPTISPYVQPTTPAPVTSNVAPTSSPMAVPLSALPTSSPIATPISALPTSSPITTPVTPSPSGSPTMSPITMATSGPTQSPVSSTLAIPIQYGISSNCGMTAYDVMNGNYNISIAEGLISATESVVIDILNLTFPRADDGQTRSGGVETPASMHGVRMRVNGLPHSPKDGNSRRHLAMLSGYKTRGQDEPQSLHELHHQRHQHLSHSFAQRNGQLPEGQHSRSLVYYTEMNPVEINDIEDVVDQNCPFGINCMRVISTVYVTLEEGDDRVEVEGLIRAGIQASFNDASFFEAIPEDTVFCPPTPASNAPTVSPVAEVKALCPFCPDGLMVPGDTMAPNGFSCADTLTFTSTLPADDASCQAVIGAATETCCPGVPEVPTAAPIAVLTPPTPAPVAQGGNDTLAVDVRYDITITQCELDAEAAMSGEGGNTLKKGLIAATTTVTIGILNTTFPRTEDGSGELTRRNLRVRKRQLVHIDESPASLTSSGNEENREHRDLVYYTDSMPVTIDRILDIEDCQPGANCLLIASTITVKLEEGDDAAAVEEAISAGMKDSFGDGTFFGAVPPDTIICP